MNKADQIIEKLNLTPHPEGGYFKENYRSDAQIDIDGLKGQYNGARNFSTAIYFLLKSHQFSAFHKIKQDEIWHYYDGSAIILHVISPDGLYSQHTLGKDVLNDELPQFVVPGDHWFAASVINKDDYALFGCTVAPGFSFDDFILAEKSMLISHYPQHKNIIDLLTH